MTSKQVATEYLKLIEDYFGPLFKLSPEEIDHVELGEEYSGYRMLSNLIANSLGDLGRDVKDFWDVHNPILSEELKNSTNMKCIYSGDLSPQNALKLTKKTAMYVDTVLIPDPLYKISVQLSKLQKHQNEFLPRILKHAANMYKLKDLLTADTEFPIVSVAPLNFEMFPEEQSKVFFKESDKKFVSYCDELFKFNFENSTNVSEHLKHIDNTEKLFNSIVNKDILPPDLKSAAEIDGFLTEYTDLSTKIHPYFKELSPGQLFASYLNSQTTRVEEHKYLCNEYGAYPICDFERPWFFMNRDLGAPSVDTGIVQGLQDEKLKWLGNIPPEAIRVLRENQELEDFRQILRKGLSDIKVQKDTALLKTVETLQENLKDCIAVHNSKTDELQKKVNKIANTDIPITTLGAMLGWIPGVGNFLSIPFTVRDWIQQTKEVERGTKELSEREAGFVNFLMKVKDEH